MGFLVLLIIVTTHTTCAAIGCQSVWLAILALAGWSLVRPVFYTLDPEEEHVDSRGEFACSMCGSRDWPNKTSSCPLCRNDAEGEEEEE